jgi:hypothetical protein
VLAKRAAEACLEVLDAAGLEIDTCIACGTEGCVYSLNNGDIAKVSGEDGEAKLVSYLMTQEQQASLPEYRGVWQLPGGCVPYGETAYLIVREDLEDVHQVLEDPASTADAAWEAAVAIQKYIQMNKRFDSGLKKHVTAFRKIVPEADKWAFDQLVEVLWWLADRGVAVPDLAYENLGYRAADRAIVLRDLGYSHVSGKSVKTKKIKSL